MERIGELAARRGATPAQIALAWLLAQRPGIVPIPGTTRRQGLEENVGATAVALGADDLREIDALLASAPVEGARYDARMQSWVDR